MATMISKHFSVLEVTSSEIAATHKIDNTVPRELWQTIAHTAAKMDEVREILEQPIRVDSWYRCPKLNELVGSKPTSQHLLGEAVDFVCPNFGNPLEICKRLWTKGIQFDQLILEHTWVHVSFASPILNPDAKPRKQVLSLLSSGGYASGLTDVEGRALT